MAHLHLRPDASSVRRAPEGFVNRQRTVVEGVDHDTLDAEVIAAGGENVRETMDTSGLRPGQRLTRSRRVSWYVIPAEATEA